MEVSTILLNTQLSLYSNARDSTSQAQITLLEFLETLKNSPYTNLVKQIRSMKGDGKKKSEIQERKKTLPGITISGTFQPRKDDHLLTHSGLLCMDFDDFIDKKAVMLMKEALGKDKHALCTFLSVSGNLAVIIQIDPLKHRESFECADRYFFKTYGISADKHAINESRLRYYSHDPEFIYNPGAEVLMIDVNYIDTSTRHEEAISYYTCESGQSDFTKLLEAIEIKEVDITQGYKQWSQVGFAIAHNFPSQGLNYFQRISRFNPEYSNQGTEKQYLSILKTIDNQSLGERKVVSLKTVFYLAGLKSIVLKKRSRTQVSISPGEDPKLFINPFDQIQGIIHEDFKVRFNTMTQEVEVNGIQVTDTMFNELWSHVTKRLGKVPPFNVLKSAIDVRTWPNYHPIKAYFESLPVWDGTDRINQVVQHMNAESPEHANLFLSKWLTGVIHCLYGTPNPLILVLVGPQNTGKTYFFRGLFPAELSDYCTESHLEEKDRVNNMSSNLVVFDDEMEGMRKMGPEVLKSLTSQSRFAVTRKYKAYESKHDRIASICAATNKPDMLIDSENRRLLPLSILGNMDWKCMNLIDRTQLMAQAYHNFGNGFNWQVTPAEIAEYGKQFERYTNEHDLILMHCSKPDPGKPKDPEIQYLTATGVLEVLTIRSPIGRLNRTNVTSALTRIGYINASKKLPGKDSNKLWALKFNDWTPRSNYSPS